MNLEELKKKSPAELLAFAEELQIENASTMCKQDIMFGILKKTAEMVPLFLGWGFGSFTRWFWFSTLP